VYHCITLIVLQYYSTLQCCTTVLGAIGGLGDRCQFVDEDTLPAKTGSLRSLLGLGESGVYCITALLSQYYSITV